MYRLQNELSYDLPFTRYIIPNETIEMWREEGKKRRVAITSVCGNNSNTISVFQAHPCSFDSDFVQIVSSPKHEHCISTESYALCYGSSSLT
jgi:hypothetical protein